MIGRLGAILFLVFAFAEPTAGQQAAPDATSPDPGYIENPTWLATPGGALIRQLYPTAANAQQVEGRVTLECIVMRDTTTRCTVSNESPAGWGFGGAALRIAEGFRIRPAVVNGEPVDGGRIRRSVRFVLPDEDAPAGKVPDPDWYAFLSAIPEIDLPYWDEAPNFYASLDAYPPDARRAHIAGRGVLSCRVKTDRRLNCELVTEIPVGMGFGQAALTLHDEFRVSERDVEFAARYRDQPFLLPITFSENIEAMPVNRSFHGVGPLTLPPLATSLEAFPEAARTAGIEGEAVVICTARASPPAECAVESESPPGWGFGAVTLEAFSAIPFAPDGSGWVLEGDQIRFTAQFRLAE